MLVSSRPVSAGDLRSKARPVTYGTAAVSYVEIPTTEFLPYDSTCAYTTDSSGWGPRWSTTSGCVFNAGLHLPSGAMPIYLELDFVDTNSTSALFGSFVECDYLAQNCT